MLEENVCRPVLNRTGAIKFSKSQLYDAIENGQIEPFYQPKTCTRTGLALGVEALARWRHPDLGTVLPENFIPLAEESGLIKQLTFSILGRAINDVQTWRDTRLGDLNLSVNLPPRMLDDVEVLNLVERLVGQSGYERHKLTFEITENAVISREANSLEVLARLHLRGFKISLDDFGTGHSNLENLRDFPFSEMKIDQSFVQGAISDEFSRACLESCVELAAARNLRVVAEGVKSEEQLRLVTDLGIDEVQGYLIAQPMPRDEFARWLSTKSPHIPSLAS